MRKITKLFAGLLASAMVLTMSTAVFASAEEKTSTSTYTDHETVTIQKKYKLTNEGTISPAETFTLEQVGAGRVTDGEASMSTGTWNDHRCGLCCEWSNYSRGNRRYYR